VGRNPNRPEIDVPIPTRAMVKFKAGKEMRAQVLKLKPKQEKKTS
jgi:DNA-binding protein HU-beta/integration host factor subunit alpha